MEKTFIQKYYVRCFPTGFHIILRKALESFCCCLFCFSSTNIGVFALFTKNVNPSYSCGTISIPTLQMRKMRVREAKGLTKSPGLEAKLGRDPDVVPGTWRGLIPAC